MKKPLAGKGELDAWGAGVSQWRKREAMPVRLTQTEQKHIACSYCRGDVLVSLFQVSTLSSTVGHARCPHCSLLLYVPIRE